MFSLHPQAGLYQTWLPLLYKPGFLCVKATLKSAGVPTL